MSHEHTVALITGAGSGVGRAVAVGFGGKGWTVGLVGRRRARLEETAALIEQAGGHAHVFVADVGDLAAVQALHEATMRAMGNVAVLVNAAGVYTELLKIEDSIPERWLETMRINVNGCYLTCRFFVPDMLQLGWGRVVNVSSAASLGAPASVASDYQLSKVTLNFFMRQLAAGLDGMGVTANVLHPGEVKSEMWEAIRDASARHASGASMRPWVQRVADTGGDPPEKSFARIWELVGPDGDTINGQFLWIRGGLKPPMPTW